MHDNSPKLATDIDKYKVVRVRKRKRKNKHNEFLLGNVLAITIHDSNTTLRMYCVYLSSPVL